MRIPASIRGCFVVNRKTGLIVSATLAGIIIFFFFGFFMIIQGPGGTGIAKKPHFGFQDTFVDIRTWSPLHCYAHPGVREAVINGSIPGTSGMRRVFLYAEELRAVGVVVTVAIDRALRRLKKTDQRYGISDKAKKVDKKYKVSEKAKKSRRFLDNAAQTTRKKLKQIFNK